VLSIVSVTLVSVLSGSRIRSRIRSRSRSRSCSRSRNHRNTRSRSNGCCARHKFGFEDVVMCRLGDAAIESKLCAHMGSEEIGRECFVLAEVDDRTIREWQYGNTRTQSYEKRIPLCWTIIQRLQAIQYNTTVQRADCACVVACSRAFCRVLN
jgi:hypothetical protein